MGSPSSLCRIFHILNLIGRFTKAFSKSIKATYIILPLSLLCSPASALFSEGWSVRERICPSQHLSNCIIHTVFMSFSLESCLLKWKFLFVHTFFTSYTFPWFTPLSYCLYSVCMTSCLSRIVILYQASTSFIWAITMLQVFSEIRRSFFLLLQ